MISDDDVHTLRVSLDVFDGPLDLLLSLVRQHQLDIATVPLATVAQQYFDYIELMDALDVELAAEYLVIAATLVFLKSKSLLPPIPADLLPEGAETAEEVEEHLRRRLIAYSRYKGVADELKGRSLEASAFFFRDAGDPGTDIVQRYRIDASRLAGALLAALRAVKPEKRTIARERLSLSAQMAFVARAVRERGQIDFLELCADYDRDGIIITFLAILELVRQRRLDARQSGPGDILTLLPVEMDHAGLN